MRAYLFLGRYSRILRRSPYLGVGSWHYHPHIHYVVPGGAFSSSDHSWHSSSRCVLLADSDHVGENKIALLQADEKSRFAAPGACRRMGKKLECTAISNHRLITLEKDRVLFRYTGANKNMSLSAFEFIRKVSPARVAHRVYENQVLRFHAPINENTGKTGP